MRADDRELTMIFDASLLDSSSPRHAANSIWATILYTTPATARHEWTISVI